MFFIIYWFTAY